MKEFLQKRNTLSILEATKANGHTGAEPVRNDAASDKKSLVDLCKTLEKVGEVRKAKRKRMYVPGEEREGWIGMCLY